jgi:hypothetical protein
MRSIHRFRALGLNAPGIPTVHPNKNCSTPGAGCPTSGFSDVGELNAQAIKPTVNQPLIPEATDDLRFPLRSLRLRGAKVFSVFSAISVVNLLEPFTVKLFSTQVHLQF